MLRLFIAFFFNDTATTEIYTLSLHDALPISRHGALDYPRYESVREPQRSDGVAYDHLRARILGTLHDDAGDLLRDRKSTRLNSSHANISYAVFCLKKKKQSSSSLVATHTSTT